MLSRIDDFIYPNRCEVIQLASQRFFYPIFKNGSSSINETHSTRLLNNQIKRCTNIDIVLRDPTERFVSGVNTFVYNTLQQNPKLDKPTIMHFVENYLFLDRHYAPQLAWIAHLNRYTMPECQLNFRDMQALKDYTPLHLNPNDQKVLTEEEVLRLQQNIHNEIYKTIDTHLMSFIGQSATFSQVLEYIKSQDPVAYSKICTALD